MLGTHRWLAATGPPPGPAHHAVGSSRMCRPRLQARTASDEGLRPSHPPLSPSIDTNAPCVTNDPRLSYGEPASRPPRSGDDPALARGSINPPAAPANSSSRLLASGRTETVTGHPRRQSSSASWVSRIAPGAAKTLLRDQSCLPATPSYSRTPHRSHRQSSQGAARSPGGPPQSSGGHARRPPKHRGCFVLLCRRPTASSSTS